MKSILSLLISHTVKNSLNAFSVVTLLALAGCANSVWNKQGATTNDFNQDNYVCVKESQRQTSSSLVGKNGLGLNIESEGTNPDIYNACMYAKGWSLQNAVTDAGNICIASNMKVGNTVTKADGSSAIIRSIFGTSSRCTRPQQPILATGEDVQQTAQETQANELYLAGRSAYDLHNYQDALVKLEKSADLGNGYAQNTIGVMYANGFGIAKDEAEAVRWYRKAAEQGNALSQSNLGYMYFGGFGVAKDEAEAIRWFRKAAEHGDAQGQYNLGTMYANGFGIAKDEAEAVRWYQKAAEQGFPNAKEELRKRGLQ